MFVLDRQGLPLMPCQPARARQLLDSRRARVARAVPFTIRLTDRLLADSAVDGVAVRVDPGATSTGLAVTHDLQRAGAVLRRGLFAIELAHRGTTIRTRLANRAAFRRRRRSANLRYRSPRSANRGRPSGWLPPSLRHRVDSSLSVVRRLCRLAPVREVHVESTAFDLQAMAAGRPLTSLEYQQGTLFGYEVRQYLLERWNHRCAFCGAGRVPFQIDHIRPRSSGGSNRISNLAPACAACNRAKAARSVEEFLTGRQDVLDRLLSQAQAPLRGATAMNVTRNALTSSLGGLGRPVHAWSGGRTAHNRHRSGLPKSHTLDALTVGALAPDTRIARHPEIVLRMTCSGRGTHQRTVPDRNGFPRLTRPRNKHVHGFATGDLVRARIPTGKHRGRHTGRVAVRTSGRFDIRTSTGLIQGVSHHHLRLVQRADGFGYTTRAEEPPVTLTPLLAPARARIHPSRRPQ
ncbi:RNA-guided endonuclease IscB [Kitasatospora albolonga]|uniref:RNA-guided endonuclease IscB n=1 Tax=Kitasatospora albolonga TaxID=68173 RepID=UPI0031E51F50